MANRLSDFTRMNPPVYTGYTIAEDLEEECRAAMLHDRVEISRLMFHVQKVEKSTKRKHTREGNRSWQAEKKNSRKSSIEIRDKPGLRRDSLTKGSHVHPRVSMIRISK